MDIKTKKFLALGLVVFAAIFFAAQFLDNEHSIEYIDKQAFEKDSSRKDSSVMSAEPLDESLLYKSHFGTLWRMSHEPDKDGNLQYKPIETLEYGWVRPHPGPFIWGQIENQEGTYDWSRADTEVRHLQENHMSILATVWPYAEWDQKVCNSDRKYKLVVEEPEFDVLGGWKYAPCDYDKYSAWLAALVERYDNDGIEDMPGLEYAVMHWEILNEPSIDPFYMGTAEEYVELLKISHDVIEAQDPQAKVLLAGFAGVILGNEEYLIFWDDVFPYIDNYFDVATLHCIGDDPQSLCVPQYISLLKENGLEKEVWITEVSVGEEYKETEADSEQSVIAVSNAFANGASVVFINKPYIEYLEGFASVDHLSSSSVVFNMPDGSKVFGLWGGAEIPQELAGMLTIIYADGTIENVDVSELRNIKQPIFVVG